MRLLRLEDWTMAAMLIPKQRPRRDAAKEEQLVNLKVENYRLKQELRKWKK